MNNMNANAFDLTVSALREKGLNSDEILGELSKMFQNMVESPQTKGVFTREDISDKEKERKIRDILLELGVPHHLNGYHYIIKAVMLYDKDHEQSITRTLYPAVANEFGVTASKVERSMRHAIQHVFDRCEWEVLIRFFGNTINPSKGKVSNSEFVALCVENMYR